MSMHADEESDEVVLPVKRSNKEGLSSAETVEGRASPKGNGGQTAAARTLRRDTASNGLAAVRRAARQSKTVRFTALLHHITTDLLKQSYLALTRDAAPGTDGVTWQAYGENLEEKLKDLHERVHRGSYRARPARRTYIPKADGSKRPQSHRTALLSHQPLGSAEVTHPFHPLRGERFVVLKVRRISGVETLSLRHSDLGSFAMPREWTDWAPPGASAVSAGKSLMIDAFGLLSLTQLVTSLTRNGGLDR